MASSQGVSKSTINNIWQAHNLKPHLVETFKRMRMAKHTVDEARYSVL